MRSCSWKDLYVAGLQGRLHREMTIARHRFAKGTRWQIRWDYDNGVKGPHVNFQCGRLKYAFRCEAEPLVDSLGQHIANSYDPARYYSAIIDQTNIMQYVPEQGQEPGDGKRLAELWEIQLDAQAASYFGIREKN